MKNRSGVELDDIKPGDIIYYVIGEHASMKHGKVSIIVKAADGIKAFDLFPESAYQHRKRIASTYVVGYSKAYVAPPKPAEIKQTPAEVAYITAARAAGKKIYGRMKGHDKWQVQEGNFQFNFSSLEYKVGYKLGESMFVPPDVVVYGDPLDFSKYRLKPF